MWGFLILFPAEAEKKDFPAVCVCQLNPFPCYRCLAHSYLKLCALFLHLCHASSSAMLLHWDALRTECPEGHVMCWCCVNCLSLDPLVRPTVWIGGDRCCANSEELVAGWCFCIIPMLQSLLFLGIHCFLFYSLSICICFSCCFLNVSLCSPFASHSYCLLSLSLHHLPPLFQMTG